MFDSEINNLSENIIKSCSDKKYKIIVAESCTGGLISAALTEVSGASKVIEGGFLVYSDALKKHLLNIPKEVFVKHGSVSRQVAYEMACGALKNSDANIALSVTGIAGPTGGTPEKPVGLVFV
ncbi:MAG: CinA family protein, partial [Rhizobiales bacterium]|nr:CinA family protein [Hyphomicrobiales bacterium]